MEREERRRINSHLASPSDLVPRGKRLRVQCNATPPRAGRPGAQIIHNCIGNAADVDVVSTSGTSVSSEPRKIARTVSRARARYVTLAVYLSGKTPNFLMGN